MPSEGEADASSLTVELYAQIVTQSEHRVEQLATKEETTGEQISVTRRAGAVSSEPSSVAEQAGAQ
jgi:hypothetical protein